MQNTLFIHKPEHEHEGYGVFLADKCIAIINGNSTKYPSNIPRIIFSLKPTIVYGLSHEKVISAVLDGGDPYVLCCPKAMAHNLFEHGMKASWGTVKRGKSVYLTRLETFYSFIETAPDCDVISSMVYYTDQQMGDYGVQLNFSHTRVYIANSRKFDVREGEKIIYLGEDALASIKL